jgi:mannose/fructose/N-acetylgalactosamine-specific phosphotransferase system component IID
LASPLRWKKNLGRRKRSRRVGKAGLMGPFAGLGDSLLKFTWLPICGSIRRPLRFREILLALF